MELSGMSQLITNPGEPVMFTLNKNDLGWAAFAGARQHVNAIDFAQRSTTEGRDPKLRWGDCIEGICGELALAKHLNVFYCPSIGPQPKHEADVGLNIQVRTTNGPNLIIKPKKDNLDHVFYMIKGNAPTYQIMGWIQGKKALNMFPVKHPEGFPDDVIFVPPKHLNSTGRGMVDSSGFHNEGST